MITTELIPSIPNELFRMYSTRFSRRGSPTIKRRQRTFGIELDRR